MINENIDMRIIEGWHADGGHMKGASDAAQEEMKKTIIITITMFTPYGSTSMPCIKLDLHNFGWI